MIVSEYRTAAEGWSKELLKHPRTSDKFHRTKTELFVYLDSLLDDTENLIIALKFVSDWRINVVVEEYILHLLDDDLLALGVIIRVIYKMSGLNNLAMFSCTLRLYKRRLINAEELRIMAIELHEKGQCTVFGLLKYILGKESADDLIDSGTPINPLYWTASNLMYVAVVSKKKTRALAETLVRRFGPEQVLEHTIIHMDIYASEWMLFAEKAVIDASGKSLMEFDKSLLPKHMRPRLKYLIRSLDNV